MLERLSRLGNFTLDILLPQTCMCCGREGYVICPSCRSRLPQVKPPLCLRCGLPLAGGNSSHDCHSQNFVINGIRSVYTFEGILRQAIHAFKYNNLRTLSRPLSLSMAEYLNTGAIAFEVLVPVPLHASRLKQRGYNQSLLLAKEVGRLCGVAVETQWLQRRINTPPQVKTRNTRERYQNMQGAFTCHAADLTGQKILLIDDVATTGATLNACAVALRQAHADSVWGLTLAREV